MAAIKLTATTPENKKVYTRLEPIQSRFLFFLGVKIKVCIQIGGYTIGGSKLLGIINPQQFTFGLQIRKSGGVINAPSYAGLKRWCDQNKDGIIIFKKNKYFLFLQNKICNKAHANKAYRINEHHPYRAEL